MSAVAFPAALSVEARRGAPAGRRPAARRCPPVGPCRRPLLAGVVLGVVLLAGAGAGGGEGRAPVPVAQAGHVVRPGDTLWTIARAFQPSGDVRPLVDRLAAGRRGAPLQPGERVLLPR